MTKESTLFPIDNLVEDLVLAYVDKEVVEAYSKYFDDKYTAYQLDELIDPIRRWTANKKLMMKDQRGQVKPCPYESALHKPKKRLKKTSCTCMAVIFSNVENTKLFVSSLRNEVQSTIKLCIESFYVPAKDFYNGKGGKIILSKQVAWYGFPYYISNYPWFQVFQFQPTTLKNTGHENYLTIEPALYFAFHKIFAEQPINGCVDTLPKGELKTLLSEKSIVLAYPALLCQFRQNNLALGRNGRVHLTTIRKCANQLHLEEFYPDAEDSTLKLYRANLAINSLAIGLDNYFLHSREQKELPIEKFLKIIFNYWDYQLITQLVLSHLSNLKSYYDHDILEELLHSVLALILQYPVSDKWISFDEFWYSMLNMPGGFEQIHVTSITQLESLKVLNLKHDKRPVSAADFKTELCEPALKNLILLLASIGLFDVAYRDYKPTDASWGDGLEYLRLTNLGKYVLGLTSEYKSEYSLEQQEFCEADPNLLLVRSLSDNNPYETLLNDVGTPIGNKRYAITYGSFLKNSKNPTDVDNNIQLFKKCVKSADGPVWQQFFTTLSQHYHPLEKAEQNEYVIYRIKPTDKELIHLLSTDSKLKEWTIRAENLMILVRPVDVPRLSDRLKHFGFIL